MRPDFNTLSHVTRLNGGRRLHRVLILALKSFKPIKEGNMQKHTRLQKALVTRLARANREASPHRAPAERLRFGEEHTRTICCVFVIVSMKRNEGRGKARLKPQGQEDMRGELSQNTDVEWMQGLVFLCP